MDDQDKPFEVLSVGKMKAKYYHVDETASRVTLSPEHVPEPLRELIPFAERWGISDDVLRINAVRSASPEEIEYLRRVVVQFDDLLDEWLAGPEATSLTPSEEYLAFSNMRMAADGC